MTLSPKMMMIWEMIIMRKSTLMTGMGATMGMVVEAMRVVMGIGDEGFSVRSLER
jgi:hypothetical protein